MFSREKSLKSFATACRWGSVSLVASLGSLILYIAAVIATGELLPLAPFSAPLLLCLVPGLHLARSLPYFFKAGAPGLWRIFVVEAAVFLSLAAAPVGALFVGIGTSLGQAMIWTMVFLICEIVLLVVGPARPLKEGGTTPMLLGSNVLFDLVDGLRKKKNVAPALERHPKEAPPPQ